MKKIILSSIFAFFACCLLFSQSVNSAANQNQNNSTQNNSAQNANQNTLLQQNINQLNTITTLSNNVTPLASNPQLALSTSDYLVTAGDVYSLVFAVGSSSVTYNIPVDSSYKIRVANLAVINAYGKTFSQLKTQVEDIVTKNYPMSGVQFVIVTPAVFKVTIEGEVKQTEIREAWALTRLSNALQDTFTPYSSDRDIIIQSANGTRKTYDLFKASRFGDLSQDPYLRPDDKIIINKIKRNVTINGAVERPGTYSILDGEELKTLIEYYGGGLTEYADTSRIEVTRYNAESLSNLALYLNQKNIDENFPLKNYDSVLISIATDLLPVMFIEGAITDESTDTSINAASNSKRTVRFNPETNYAYLVRSNEMLFGTNSDLERAYIIRGDKYINVDLRKMLYDSTYYSDEIVQPNDTLMIPFKQSFVSVAGAVRTPGRYPYIPGRDWEYYIGLAGGFDKSMNTGGAIKIKDMDGKTLKKTDAITPESTITAETNSFTYHFNKYANIIITLGTLLSSIVSISVLIQNMSK